MVQHLQGVVLFRKDICCWVSNGGTSAKHRHGPQPDGGPELSSTTDLVHLTTHLMAQRLMLYSRWCRNRAVKQI